MAKYEVDIFFDKILNNFRTEQDADLAPTQKT